MSYYAYDDFRSPAENFRDGLVKHIANLERNFKYSVESMANQYDGDMDGGDTYHYQSYYNDYLKNAKSYYKQLVFWRAVQEALTDDQV